MRRKQKTQSQGNIEIEDVQVDDSFIQPQIFTDTRAEQPQRRDKHEAPEDPILQDNASKQQQEPASQSPLAREIYSKTVIQIHAMINGMKETPDFQKVVNLLECYRLDELRRRFVEAMEE